MPGTVSGYSCSFLPTISAASLGVLPAAMKTDFSMMAERLIVLCRAEAQQVGRYVVGTYIGQTARAENEIWATRVRRHGGGASVPSALFPSASCKIFYGRNQLR